MSSRARLYLLFAGLRGVGTAVILALIGPERAARIYNYMIDPVPAWAWIGLWASIGAVLIWGAIRKSPNVATWGLILMATATAVWGMGLTLGALDDPELLGVSVVLWWALVFKDLIQVRQPLSSPFEDLVAHYEKR